LGWINDDKLLAYVAGQATDISEFGLAVVAAHVEITERSMAAVGRVQKLYAKGRRLEETGSS
jgi:hypothetical protein